MKYNVDKSNQGLNSWSIDKVIDVITLEESPIRNGQDMVRVNDGIAHFRIDKLTDNPKNKTRFGIVLVKPSIKSQSRAILREKD